MFSGDLPEILVEPLTNNNLEKEAVVCGALIEAPTMSIIIPGEKWTYSSVKSIVLMQSDGHYRLIGMTRVGDQPWQVLPFSENMLRPESLPKVELRHCRGMMIPVFSIVYPMEEGNLYDLFVFDNNQLWKMIGHGNEAKGIDIMISGGYATLTEDATEFLYAVFDRFWVEYMESVQEFPHDRAACERMQKQWKDHWDESAAEGWVEIQGANLRAEPTQKSESLGVYYRYVPARYLGDAVSGTQWPWLHLQIGETEGWMSGAYVRLEGPSADPFPVQMGRAVNGCIIYRNASESAQSMWMPPGTDFHVLAAKGQEWYHVCVPRDTITWEVDSNGVFGYVHPNEVLVGAGLNELDTLEHTLAERNGI